MVVFFLTPPIMVCEPRNAHLMRVPYIHFTQSSLPGAQLIV